MLNYNPTWETSTVFIRLPENYFVIEIGWKMCSFMYLCKHVSLYGKTHDRKKTDTDPQAYVQIRPGGCQSIKLGQLFLPLTIL